MNPSRFWVFRALALAVLLGLSRVGHASIYSYVVDPTTQTVNQGGGETQSTVVAPGLKSQCPKGRFLVTNDNARPPKAGTVTGRDSDFPGTPDIAPTFDAVPNPSNYTFGTNDHDIVTLPNGDVLLVWGVHSKAPLSPKPAWFDFTYHGTFGPGVRRGMMTWRSTDCGQTFQFVGEVDVAKLGDGSCAMPQPAPPGSVPAGTAAQPNYYNGGVDGQLVKVDPKTGNVYLMVQCVGFEQDKSKPGFILSSTPVNETFVLRSTNSGSAWPSLGTLPAMSWRFGVEPLSTGSLVFARYDLVSLGKKNGSTVQLPTTEQQAPTPDGWNPNPKDNPNIGAAKLVHANVWAHTVVTRVPGSQHVLVTYPATLSCGNGKSCVGYAQYFYDPIAQSFAAAPPIEPSKQGPDGFTMHLAAIDNGSGPVLLYWYDADASTKKVKIMGRAILGDSQVSSDFVVAQDAASTPHTFNLLTNSDYWFGDYKTAGGFAPHGIINKLKQTFDYYPLWVEPDGHQHFSHVQIEQTTTVSAGFKKFEVVGIPKFKLGPPPVEMTRRTLTVLEQRFVRDQQRELEVSLPARTPAQTAKPPAAPKTKTPSQQH